MSNAVRVLVVEDEVLICSFIEDALSDGGFEACSVHSGEAALSTFRDGHEGCQALLTDVNLGGGISGWDLARQVREIAPGFPVVYMTSAKRAGLEIAGRRWQPSDREALCAGAIGCRRLAATRYRDRVGLNRIAGRLRSFGADQRIVSVAAMAWPCTRQRREPPRPPSSPAAGLCPLSKRTRAA
ncbi:response regulator [Bradyrhizobium sp. AUGA SZCCT0124]|uniref:response regulator n=1 Tax=unclassified Bradyrhizobium TaxID=2631580 RepID=UPI00390833B8